MSDLNKEALDVWGALKPMIDQEISSRTQGMVQRRKAKVTTAPSLSTGIIGVTEPFGTEYFIPFNTNLTTASVGDFVWVEFMYGATNAFASMYASADTKDWTVGGDANIIGNATINGVLDVTPRRTYAYLTTPGWYRVLTLVLSNASTVLGGDGIQIDFVINRAYGNTNGETHRCTLSLIYNNAKFVDESSRSNVFGIKKIRYNTNTVGTYRYGCVDIYYDLTSSNPVYVDFTVHQAAESIQAAITASDLTGVLPYPADETEMTSHDFSANASAVQTANVSNVLKSGSFTNSDRELNWTATDSCWFYGSFVMQANTRGQAYIEVNNVRIFDFDLSASIGHQMCFVPVPLQGGDKLYVNVSSNDTSTYKIVAMR